MNDELPAYTIIVIRHNTDKTNTEIRYEYYGILRELLADIEKELEHRKWFNEDKNE